MALDKPGREDYKPDAGRRLITDIVPRHVARLVREMSALSRAELDELGRLCRRLGRGDGEASRGG